MAQRRSHIVDAFISGVYHCTSRCVRKESLLRDPLRRAWIIARLEFLAHFAAIDVVSFCAMSNHLHLLLVTHPELVATWSDYEVARRKVILLACLRMHSKSLDCDEETALEREIAMMLSIPARIRAARRDLSSLSFFHKLLKEPCAKMWNREDNVTGHFWEGRFKSRKVLDWPSLERVAAYIELNEVHARVATSIPTSLWSSGQLQWERLSDGLPDVCADSAVANASVDASQRVLELRWEPVFPCQSAEGEGLVAHARPPMFPTECANRAPSLLRHIHRVDQAGRRRRPDKAGWISKSQPDAVSEAIARVLPRLLRGSRAVKLAARSIERWWREMRRAIDSQLDPIPFDQCALSMLDAARGSCYGSKEAVAREALRRGQRRMVAVWSGV